MPRFPSADATQTKPLLAPPRARRRLPRQLLSFSLLASLPPLYRLPLASSLSSGRALTTPSALQTLLPTQIRARPQQRLPPRSCTRAPRGPIPRSNIVGRGRSGWSEGEELSSPGLKQVRRGAAETRAHAAAARACTAASGSLTLSQHSQGASMRVPGPYLRGARSKSCPRSGARPAALEFPQSLVRHRT